MIDTHAHLQDEMIKDYKRTIKDANDAGVSKIVCASSNLENSKKAVDIANKFACVYATVGIHPEDANSYNSDSIMQLKQLAKNKKVVAIGEIGLDYYHEFASRDLQKEVFIKQIELANDLKLPVVLHTREASGDMIEILRKYKNKLCCGVCIHCFNMSLEILKEILNYGFYISIGGIVTFSNAKNVIEIVKNCDINRLMLETDTPYLSPVPLRGTINEPKNVVFSAKKIAEILNISLNELDEITTKNANQFFNFNR